MMDKSKNMKRDNNNISQVIICIISIMMVMQISCRKSRNTMVKKITMGNIISMDFKYLARKMMLH